MLARKQSTGPERQGKLLARPSPEGKSGCVKGERPLGLGGSRDGVLFVPSGYDPGKPAPLLLCLHGAGGHARHRIDPLRAPAERDGVVLVAPDSVGSTWDMLMRGLGPDLERIDRALAGAFAELAIDPTRVGIEGFSDGASYALSLGIANGDLFSYIFAFSPGFMSPPAQVGAPRIVVTHGAADRVLPVSCSRRLVPVLRAAGYETEYREFDGPHTVPEDAVREAMDVLVGRKSPNA
jgi:phospholipase/carboxylesterase